MNCSKVKTYLSTYLDGLAQGDRKASIEEHLLNCYSCKAAYLDLKKARGMTQFLNTDISQHPDFNIDTDSLVLAPVYLRPTTLRLAASFAAAIFILIGIFYGTERQLNPYIIPMSGEIILSNAQKQDSVVLKDRATLAKADLIVSKKDSFSILNLGEDKNLGLEGKAKLKLTKASYNRFTHKEKYIFKLGAGGVIIKAEHPSYISIETAQAIIKTTGTIFFVDVTSENETVVSVLEGEVLVRLKGVFEKFSLGLGNLSKIITDSSGKPILHTKTQLSTEEINLLKNRLKKLAVVSVDEPEEEITLEEPQPADVEEDVRIRYWKESRE